MIGTRVVEICGLFRRVIREAAALGYEMFWSPDASQVVGKGEGGDEARKVDIELEKNILMNINSSGFDTLVVSEESGVHKIGESPQYVTLVDPLDGSLNYVSKIPFASVSIAVYKLGASMNEPIYASVRSIFGDVEIELCEGFVKFNGEVINHRFKTENEIVSMYVDDIRDAELIIEALRNQTTTPKYRTMGSAALEAALAALGFITHFIHLTGRLRNIDVSVGIALAHRLGSALMIEPPLVEISVERIEKIRRLYIGPHDSSLYMLLKRKVIRDQ